MADSTPTDRVRIHPLPPVPFPGRSQTGAHLSAPLTSFVGREREVGGVVDLLRRADVRLVTLTGPGGVGKTRLALRVAGEAAAAFPDGVWFEALAPVRAPTLVPAAIASALELPESGDLTPEERVRDFLAGRRALLVLDNLEHLLDAGRWLAALLTACPGLTVLATSREVLRLSGEHVVAVPPLSLPRPASMPGVDGAAESEAVHLFVKRARASLAGFAFTLDNAGAVGAICVRLDGLPLAIELAAARVKHLPPPALLGRLERRLPVLTGGPRDQPARLQTMRDAIAWSHDLLSGEERILFRCLSVFVGGFTLEAAGAVVGSPGGGGTDPFEGIASLVDKSLLRQEAGPGDEARYGMLETVREYARERLVASGEAEVVQDRQAAYILGLAERAAPSPWKWGAVEPAWADRLEAEYGNLRVALAWLVARGNAECCLRLATAAWESLGERGHLREGRAMLDQALALPGDPPAACRARALVRSAWAASQLGDQEAAAAVGRRALAVARALGDAKEIAFALVVLGCVAMGDGDLDRAERLHEEALATARAGGDPAGGAMFLNNLGLIALFRGDHARAASLYEEHLTAARAAGWDHTEGVVLNNLAQLAREQGDLGRAARLDLEALDLGYQRRDPALQAVAIETAASVAGAAGMAERAARLLAAAEALRERAGAPLLRIIQTEHERDLALARRGLTEAAFAAAWAAGRALPAEEVLGEAETALVALATGAAPESASPAPPPAHLLSPRELEVVRLLAEGRSNRAIAEALFVSQSTVISHVRNILDKLGLNSRAAVAAWAVRRGLA